MTNPKQPDWQGLFKAIRAISGELRLDNVIKIFLQSLLEHSRAQAAVLVLPNDRCCRLEIPDEILFHQTRQTTVLPENPLDVPLFRRNSLISMIYLEHRREMDVFTPSRVEAIEILSQQWIIALENARMYYHCYEKLQQHNEVNQLSESTEPLKTKQNFNQHFEQEWLRMTNEGLPLSIILCSPDHWDQYQTKEGEEKAKEALEKIGRVIQSRLKRAADVVAHYDNGILVILLPMTPWEGALHVSEDIQQIMQLLQLPQKVGSDPFLVSLSMGLASVLSCRESLPEAILEIAEDLLKEARKQGGHCILSENI